MSPVVPPQTVEELLNRAWSLSGKSISDLIHIAEQSCFAVSKDKGRIGQVIEKYLGAVNHSYAGPDFSHLGVELKTIPVTPKAKPLESTFVCMVPNPDVLFQRWETSLVKAKLSCVLWLPIVVFPETSWLERRIGAPALWRPSSEEESILRQDWEEFVEIIQLGRIAEVTGRWGQYLQIRPKALNSRSQCYGINEQGDKILTLPRGFYLRASFTEKIIYQNFSLGNEDV